MLYNSLQHALSLFILLCLHQSFLPMADVPFPLGSWTIPMPQLPACNSNSSQGLNHSSPLIHSSTHSHTHKTNSAGWVKLPLSRPTENTTCNISSIVAWSHHGGDVFPCCMYMGHYLAMGLHATILWQDWITWQETSSVARQWQSKHTYYIIKQANHCYTMNKHATVEELLVLVFPVQSNLRTVGAYCQLQDSCQPVRMWTSKMRHLHWWQL
jgi:hypothetical protein